MHKSNNYDVFYHILCYTEIPLKISNKGGSRMNIAICDDDLQCSGMLNIMLEEYAAKHNLKDFTVYIYSHADDLIDAIQDDEHFDICILDIMMPDISGIELGIKLRNDGYEGIIIYLTASKDYALDSYKAKAFNYILKPIVPADLYQTLDDALKDFSGKSERFVVVKTKEGNTRISLNNILYIQLSKRVLVYYLTDGSTLEGLYLRVPFATAVQDFLLDKSFVQCGAGIVVNISLVSTVTNEVVTFHNNQTAYFSKKICTEICNAWNDYNRVGGKIK